MTNHRGIRTVISDSKRGVEGFEYACVTSHVRPGEREALTFLFRAEHCSEPWLLGDSKGHVNKEMRRIIYIFLYLFISKMSRWVSVPPVSEGRADEQVYTERPAACAVFTINRLLNNIWKGMFHTSLHLLHA